MIEILTRKDPYEGMGPLEVVLAVTSQGYRHPIPSEVPSWFAELLKKCWNENPDDRPSFNVIFDTINKNVSVW